MVGSQDETDQTNGLAHLLEHMAFKGTHTRNAYQIANEIESLGGSINAFTSRTLTCFFVRLMSEHLAKGVEVLSDLVLNPRFDGQELEKEKGVIAEEIREIEDTPSEVIHDLFTGQLFPDHPLGRPIQGTVENVRSFTNDQLIQFIKTQYSPERILVVASGRVKHADLVKLVEKYLLRLDGDIGLEKPFHLEAIRERNRIYKRPIAQAHIIVGRRVFPQGDPRRYILALLNIILSGGMTSRLFHNIRERYGFVYAIYSFADLFLHTGLFGIYAGVESGELDNIRQMIYAELKRLVTEPVPELELRKVKQQFEGGLVISLENMQARMHRLARMEIYEQKLLKIDTLLDIIDGITARDLQEVAKYLQDEETYIETVIVPEQSK